jgi:hypothetical protein
MAKADHKWCMKRENIDSPQASAKTAGLVLCRWSARSGPKHQEHFYDRKKKFPKIMQISSSLSSPRRERRFGPEDSQPPDNWFRALSRIA